MFLGGYSTLKKDHVIFTYTRWPVNAKKNCFHCSLAIYSFFKLPEKPHHVSVIFFFLIYGSFCKIDVLPLGVLSIRNSNLCNLKGNGNAAKVILFVSTRKYQKEQNKLFEKWQSGTKWVCGQYSEVESGSCRVETLGWSLGSSFCLLCHSW